MMFCKETDFQETAIGKIPKDWTVKCVSELFQVETGTTPSTAKKVDYWEKGTMNWLTPADMSKSDGAIYISSGERRITEKAVRDCNLTVMPKGSLILSTRAPVGYVAVLSEESAFNQGCKGLIPREHEDVYPEFYYYYLMSKKQILNNLSSGSTFKELSKEMLEKVRVVFLKPREQKWIVEVLSCVDLAIQKTDEVIAKTERLKKGLMQKLLTEGIGHKEFKDTEIGKIPKEWRFLKLEQVLNNIRYGTSAKSNTACQGIPVLGIPNVIGGKIDDSDLRYVALTETELEGLTLKQGDILLVRTNANPDYIGRCALFDKANRIWVYASYLIMIRPDKEKVIPEYLVRFLQSERARRQFLSTTRTSAGNYNINSKGIESIAICLPDRLEQQRIAQVLSTVDTGLELELKQKAKLERIKLGLMDLLLSGKVRVKVD